MKRSIAVAFAVVLACGLAAAQAPRKSEILSLDAKKESKAPPAPPRELLKEPSLLKEKAPDVFRARFETTKGDFVVEAHRDWAPHGTDRFYNLVKNGYYDGVKFFGVVPGFVVQFGIHGDPTISTKWLGSTIQDDPVVKGNKKGFMTFAMSGNPNSRSVQVFINLQDNSRLDASGFAAFGQIVEGMDVVERLYGEYGEKVTGLQTEIARAGNEFLQLNYPKLDSIDRAFVEK